MQDDHLPDGEATAVQTVWWGDDAPDERDAVTKEFDRKTAMLAQEWEKQKTFAQRILKGEEEKKKRAADAARVAESLAQMYGEPYGRVKRPGRDWQTASELRGEEREHRRRADRIRAFVAIQTTRLEVMGVATNRLPQTRTREPRRHVRGRAHRPRGPSTPDDPSEPEPPSSWAYLARASQQMRVRQRRREARWRRGVAA